MRFRALVVIPFVVVTALALAAPPAPEAAPGPAPLTLESFAWLAGTWKQEDGDSVWEEHWLTPRGDSVAAVTRWVKGGRTRLFELTAIEKDEKGFTLTLRHFGRGLKASGEGILSWRLLRLVGREATFEDAKRTFPRRIVYRRPDDDHLEVRLEGTIGGEETSQGFRFTRVD